MTDRADQTKDPLTGVPEDLTSTAQWLRGKRMTTSEAELDRIKRRVLARPAPERPYRRPARRSPRFAGIATSLAAIVIGIGGAFTIAGTPPPSMPFEAANGSYSSAQWQYLISKKCALLKQHFAGNQQIYNLLVQVCKNY